MSADEIRSARMRARELRHEATIVAGRSCAEALNLMNEANQLDNRACLAEMRLPERRVP